MEEAVAAIGNCGIKIGVEVVGDDGSATKVIDISAEVVLNVNDEAENYMERVNINLRHVIVNTNS